MVKIYMERKAKSIGRGLQQQSQAAKNAEWKKLVISTLELTIGIEDFDFLFEEVRGFFFRNEQIKQFNECLEYFIINNKIKSVPQEVFRELVYFYQNLNKIHVIQSLLTSMDIKQLEFGFVISMCVELALYTPLIYVCTHLQNDFIAPLNKLFEEYRNIKDTHNEQAKRYIYKCMWFIQITFQGKMYPDTKIPDEQFPVVFKQIIIWLFEEDIITILAKIDIDLLLELILMLYEGRLREILSQKDKDLT